MCDAVTHARVLRAMTSDHQVRFAVLDAAPLWDGVRRGHPHLEAEPCAYLVEVLAGALLLQSRNFFSERLQLVLKGAGRVKALVADSWPDGDIRGVADLAESSDLPPGIQGPGLLQVMRSTPHGQPYIGTLERVEGSIGQQLEAYLLQSEQIQASITLWCDPTSGEAGGLLVEPMPNCPLDRLERLVHAIEGLEVVPNWERTPEFLCQWINQGEGSEILDAKDIAYRCRCNRESLVGILKGFSPAKRSEIFTGPDAVEIRCDYCGKAYLIRPEDCLSVAKGDDEAN